MKGQPVHSLSISSREKKSREDESNSLSREHDDREREGVRVGVVKEVEG